MGTIYRGKTIVKAMDGLRKNKNHIGSKKAKKTFE